MKRVSVIDVGSNSVRLLMARVDEGNIQPLYKTLRTTRLGAGVDTNHVLSPGAVEATLGRSGTSRKTIPWVPMRCWPLLPVQWGCFKRRGPYRSGLV